MQTPPPFGVELMAFPIPETLICCKGSRRPGSLNESGSLAERALT